MAVRAGRVATTSYRSSGISAAAPAPTTPLWRNRDFMALWSSQVVSTVGTRITSIAYPLLVLAMTGSPVQAGLVGFAQTLPFLVLFLPAGAYVDRWDRRKVMLVADIGRAVALGSVALATAVGVVSVPQLVVVALVEGSLFVFFDLCEGAALPQIVPPEQLPAAVAQNQARTQGADLVGQPLGGILFGLGRAIPFAADALSYVISFAAILTIRTPLQASRPADPAAPPLDLRAEIAEGIATVWGQPFLRIAIVVVAGLNFASNALSLVLIVRAQDLGAGPGLIGLMFAFFGAGAILGSIVAPWVHARVGTRKITLGLTWLAVAEYAALAFLPNVLALGVAVGIGSIGAPIFNVALSDVIYRITPDRLLGRVRSVVKAIAWGTIPAGTLAAGFLASGLGAPGALLVLAAVVLVGALVATLSRGMHLVPA
ncbi:MAG TPA: MFS transporter [Candidatus Limnocylindrales bacterium]|nr:MFS transporter [Candidatus Limnocylindrales bacterium]